MNTSSKPHPLCDMEKPWSVIRFIHKGSEREFYTMINTMTGDRMTAFDNDPPSINDPVKWIKSVFRDIHKRSDKVLNQQGTKHFK
jgi:hypothetical protein